MTTDASVRDRVRRFVVDTFLYMRPQFAFTDGESLLQKGIVDSLGAMELIGFVEETWNVSVPTEDITAENFGSVNGIVQYVLQHAPAS